MDQQPRIDGAGRHGLLNLVERHDDELEVRLVEAQRQVRRGQRARDGYPRPLDAVGPTRTGDDDRAVAVAHAGAVR